MACRPAIETTIIEAHEDQRALRDARTALGVRRRGDHALPRLRDSIAEQAQEVVPTA
jgi:hypothetical protein